MESNVNAVEYINGLIERARAAQAVAENYTQERVLELARAIGWLTVLHAEEWAKMTQEETGMGDYKSKVLRLNNRPRGVLSELVKAKTVGVIEINEEKGLMKIAKPVGVIGAIVPTTVPETTVVIKGMNSIMGRNAIIFSPRPRSKKIANTVADAMRSTLKKFGAPEDLFICIKEPTMALSQELMKQSDLVIATGGAGLVKAAYSSGTPAYGVGVGNVVSVIDETADLMDAAQKIMESKINDLATGCSTENSLVIQEDIYNDLVKALIDKGAYLVNKEEKAKLQSTLWKDGILNGEVICKPAVFIAEKSGFSIPEDRTFILVEEEGIGPGYPFSSEKLSVVLTLYKYNQFEEAIEKVNRIQSFKGSGHSCGIHSFDEDRIMEFSLKTKTSRVMIRQPQNKANAGNFTNGMPFTISLGCGTWGGNITTENITWKHYINTTWVARSIKSYEPTDEELFGDIMKKF